MTAWCSLDTRGRIIGCSYIAGRNSVGCEALAACRLGNNGIGIEITSMGGRLGHRQAQVTDETSNATIMTTVFERRSVGALVRLGNNHMR